MHGAELTTAQSDLVKQKPVMSIIRPNVEFDEAGNLKSVAMPDTKGDYHLIGMRTTKECFQAPQITSV